MTNEKSPAQGEAKTGNSEYAYPNEKQPVTATVRASAAAGNAAQGRNTTAPALTDEQIRSLKYVIGRLEIASVAPECEHANNLRALLTSPRAAVGLTTQQRDTLEILARTSTPFACEVIRSILDADRDALVTTWHGINREAVRQVAIEHGFVYWRAPDAHGVKGTIQQATGLLQYLLAVEVEINPDEPECATCNGNGMIGGPSFSAPDEGGVPCPDCAASVAEPAPDQNTELASMTRMFHAACADLGLINEALGLDPDDGGAEPILDAIQKLKDERDQWADAGYAAQAVAADGATQDELQGIVEACEELGCPDDMTPRQFISDIWSLLIAWYQASAENKIAVSDPAYHLVTATAALMGDGRAAVSPATADERAAFEADCLRRGYASRDLTRIEDGYYVTAITYMWDGWQAARASQAAAPADAREPVLYQSRVRQNDEKRPWTKWENCSKEAAEDYRKRSMTDDWNIEIRELFDYPVSVPAAAGDAGAWKSAESDTPNDEREVIVFLNGHCALTDMECRKGGGWGIRLGFYDHEKRYWRVHGQKEYFVTHWRDLPEPPDSAPLDRARAQGAQGGKGGEA